MQAVTQHIAKEARNAFCNGNLVYSPSSIEVALAMVAHGSKGETLKQLLNFLGCKIREDLYFRSRSAKLKAIVSQNGGGGLLVRLANGLWVDKRFPIVPSYKEILKTFYHTEATSVDFLNKVRYAYLINKQICIIKIYICYSCRSVLIFYFEG